MGTQSYYGVSRGAEQSLQAESERERELSKVSPEFPVVGFVTSASNVGPLVMPVAFGHLIDLTGYYSASVFMVAILGGVIFVGCARFMR